MAGSAAPSAAWRVIGEPLLPATGEGVLAGLRVAVKDLFAVPGQRIGAGNPTWLREAHSEVVAAGALAVLLREGAHVRGIVATDEFGYGMFGTNEHYPTPPNPAAPGRLPGGSSSGPASAVAAGDADIGLATDTAGSIRVPASYCGLFGFRPTHGLVTDAGRLDLAPSFDTVGWLTRSADLLSVVGDLLLPVGTVPPITELVLAEDLFELVPPSAQGSLREAAQRYADRAGLSVRAGDSTLASHAEEWGEALGILQAVEMWATYGEWVRSHPGAMSPAVETAMRAGSEVPEEYLAWARASAAAARGVCAQALAAGSALVQPATAGPAPVPGTIEVGVRAALGNVHLVCAASLAGLPVLTLPGSRAEGAPIGLSLVGAAGSDRALLATCAAH